MTEFTMDRLWENLNIVDVFDHIFDEEAKSKRKRAYEKQIQMSGFLHHCTVINIKGESYRLKERKDLCTRSSKSLTLFLSKATLDFVIPLPRRRKTTKFLRRFLTISNWR